MASFFLIAASHLRYTAYRRQHRFPSRFPDTPFGKHPYKWYQDTDAHQFVRLTTIFTFKSHPTVPFFLDKGKLTIGTADNYSNTNTEFSHFKQLEKDHHNQRP